MSWKQIAYEGGIALAVLLAIAVAFVGNQNFAVADEANGQEITNQTFEELCASGMVQFCSGGNNGSGNDNGNGGTDDDDTDPCTIFDQMGNLPPQCDEDDDDDNNGGGDDDDDDNGGGDDDGDDTTPPPTSGGSTDAVPSSGGSGCGSNCYPDATTTAATTTGEILGSATTTATSTTALADVACDAYLTEFIKPGADNDTEQVTRLQLVLKMFEGHNVEATGVYDEATVSAVHEFQTKYAADILAPWGISKSTGFVYLTTRKKVNEVYCDRGMTFPLSSDEQQVIEKAKVAPQAQAGAAAAAAPTPPARPAARPEAPRATTTTTTDEAEESVTESPWSRVGDFFRRLFNRAR